MEYMYQEMNWAINFNQLDAEIKNKWRVFMNIDFHYYGTFLAARLAGFENDEALRIAHSSQYVNESNASMIDPQLKGLLGETPQPTAIEGSEYNEYCKN